MAYTVVLGANFGDEGKGHLVDWFAKRESLVVRFNGGAQAGHTVVTPDGLRHVFSHFGSGSFRGAATYLSEHFLVNPLLWEKERLELLSKGIALPQLFVSPEAFVTTPFDMLVNQEVERARGASRHGSCGAGINETVTRSENPMLALTVNGLKDLEQGNPLFEAMRGYALARFTTLTGQKPPERFLDRLHSRAILGGFLDQCEQFLQAAHQHSPLYDSDYKDVVFEGAQGLLLDEKHSFFPHVTRSRTGLTNLQSLRLRAKTLHVVFVTRAYMTRHGVGPFPSEGLVAGILKDDTNVVNEFQGSIRFGPLDLQLMRDTIFSALRVDIKNVAPSVAVTCLDQMSDPDKVLDDLRRWIPAPVRYVSYGPIRSDIREV
jgi:adenylosuccinate synthase